MGKGKRILIAAGGTGGHLYPAQGLCEELQREEVDLSILFAAQGLATSPFFDRSRFAFKEVSSSSLRGGSLSHFFRGGGTLLKGIWESFQLLREFRPDLVIGFGSYYSVPQLIAARLLGVRFLLYESDSIPGKANRYLAPFAHKVAVHFPSAAKMLKGDITEVAMPLRFGYRLGMASKEEALSYFGLEKNRSTLVVFGGSQGAQRLNQLVLDNRSLFRSLQIQVIHLTGKSADPSHVANLYRSAGVKSCVKTFEDAMYLAWHASDFFIGRAGASTIAEAIAFEVPGILIPYPHATGGHQEANADFFVNTVHGGVVFSERNLDSLSLFELMTNWSASGTLVSMRRAIQKYKAQSYRIPLSQLVLESFL